MVNHFYIFLSIILGVVSQLIIKWKMRGFSFSATATISDKFLFALSRLLDPWIIFSLLCTLLAGLAWMIAMTRFDLSYAYPFTMLGFVLVLLLSSLFFAEPVTWQKLVGLLLITVGILISSLTS